MSAKYFQLKVLKAMEILRGEQMRGSEKNVKAKVKRALHLIVVVSHIPI